MPFVLVTAVSDRDYIIEAKSLDVNGYILKPVTFQRVTNKLKEIFPEKKFPKAAKNPNSRLRQARRRWKC